MKMTEQERAADRARRPVVSALASQANEWRREAKKLRRLDMDPISEARADVLDTVAGEIDALIFRWS